MKKFKHVALLLLATVMMFGCSKYDDTELRNDVSDLQSRVEKLEKWCEATNTQISALQGIVTALEAKDYVTGVSPITEGSETVGYTITFSKSGAVTIKNGKDGVNGVTPIIGVAKHTDDLYYWTVKTSDADADWLLDADGKMIRTTGDKGTDGSIGADGKTPVLSVATDTDGKVYWKVNGEWLLMDGKKVQATGDKGDKGDNGAAGSAGKDGDSIFKKDGIDLTDSNNVTFTLNDGKDTKITFPRTSAVKIFDSFDNFKIATLDAATDLTLALNIKDADYKAIKAELTSSAGLTTAIKTRAATTPWEVAITAPTFKADGTVDAQPVVSITAKDAAEGDIALLKVTIIDSKGNEHASIRVLFYSTKVDVESVTIDETLALTVNEEHTLTATVLPAGATQTVTWTSSDETVAAVSTDGKVKGLKAGTTTIKAASTTNADKFDECTVTVNTVAVTGITLSDATLTKGSKKILTATIVPANATVQTVTWSSNNTNVATINATTGEVESIAKGEATITATATDGSSITGTCKVTVTDGPTFGNEGDPDIDGESAATAYAIGGKEDLMLLATRINGSESSNWNNKYYKLTSDIDFDDSNTDTWIPIGKDNNSPFKGYFDGGDHVIKGKLKAPASATYFGIFGYGEDFEIKSLHFQGSIDVTDATGLKYFGGIIARGPTTTSYVGTILNCSNAANLTATTCGVGGIIGEVSTVRIIACVNTGNLTSTTNSVGGIALNPVKDKLFGCINKGAISADATKSSGGIASQGGAKACWSTATSISGKFKGYIVGFVTTEIKECYWTAISGMNASNTVTNTESNTFTGHPTTAQITAMNAEWANLESDRKYRFNATTGEIEKIP